MTAAAFPLPVHIVVDRKHTSRRERLDVLTARRGLTASREQARRLIMAGAVVVNDQRIDKPGTLVDSAARVRIKDRARPRYVSRGGLKLEAALRAFSLEVSGRVALDVGASTGGFTDCLLQHGAAQVFAVDVGYGQLAWSLRQDPRVVNIERQNIRTLDPAFLSAQPSLSVIDASFISLTRVIPAVVTLLALGGHGIALIKPQFELGKGRVGKGGVVRDPALHTAVVNRLQTQAADWGLRPLGLIESPVLGSKGNTEFLWHWQKRED